MQSKCKSLNHKLLKGNSENRIDSKTCYSTTFIEIYFKYKILLQPSKSVLNFVNLPVFLIFYLKSSKPHQPIQSIMIRRYKTRASFDIARFTLELVFFPYYIIAIKCSVSCPLKDNFCPFFRNTLY